MPSSSTSAAPKSPVATRRRDWQKEQTRFDLSMAAYELARAEGLTQVRVPQIADAAGVSTRTFNNYFPSKEAAIVWPTTLWGQRLAAELGDRPTGESLADALVNLMVDRYRPDDDEGLPAGWLDGFRSLVAAEPSLHGEYLKAQSAGERALAAAIADRTGAADTDLEPLVLAGIVSAAERAAVLHWTRHPDRSTLLADVVGHALTMALRGLPDSRLN